MKTRNPKGQITGTLTLQKIAIALMVIGAAGLLWMNAGTVGAASVETEKEFRYDVYPLSSPTNWETVDHKIVTYVRNYGGKIDDDYLMLIFKACGNDTEAVKRVISVSVAESQMGSASAGRKTNFWGYFKGGDRRYDPSREQMAKDICKSMKGTYKKLIANGKVNADLEKLYVGNESVAWRKNVETSYKFMSK